MDIFQVLCLAGFLVLIIPHQETEAGPSSSILNKIKSKVCSSRFSSKFSMCKNYIVETITTTTRPTTSVQDPSPVTISATSEEPGVLGGSDNLKSVNKIHSRIGVLITNFSRQAVMSRGPDGLHVDDATLTILISTQLKCASECILDDSCLGFAYSQLSKQCQLMSDSTLDSGDFINEPDWRIYYL